MKTASWVVVVLWLVVGCSVSLKIEVRNATAVMYTYSDPYSSGGDRSWSIPDKGLQGMLRYPDPRNACSSVKVVTNDTWIAFVTDYLACPGENDKNLWDAGYVMMVASHGSTTLSLKPTSKLPQALIDAAFGEYLETNVVAVNESCYLFVTDHFPAFFEELFLIVGVILVVAIIASVAVFCCSIGCQWLYQKWKHRGLSQWQIRRLPKRKYDACKDKCEACSICLEEFKDGVLVRILPCEHMFHPECVDEWLRKWRRTCPLCKMAISRRQHCQPTSAAEVVAAAERHPLLSEEQENYGATAGPGQRPMMQEEDRDLRMDTPQVEIMTESS